jgi:hypothetical protein
MFSLKDKKQYLFSLFFSPIAGGGDKQFPALWIAFP